MAFWSKNVEQANPQIVPDNLASRTFENRRFQLAWVIFLFVFLIFITEPLRHVLLVYWVYGKDAYLHGLRVIPRKPLRFSNGILVPQILDIVTGSGMFFATTLGLSLALFFALRLYERHIKK
jgi:hypothetical protein